MGKAVTEKLKEGGWTLTFHKPPLSAQSSEDLRVLNLLTQKRETFIYYVY